ncbi:cholinesterase [Metarhizium album ARSEF 1941]|uniref:Carboxylic ester hydrolase n=1 Tax=Metarhizium album (strain ARSEF 1941) TaxID=1081103 RepID=A0A0B2WPK8_METAS|nr:cholinesterase [Metarhizium album ARSEF 1941]KHN94925.1 cholinesterase [Metarhizium album ARSEF 1941]
MKLPVAWIALLQAATSAAAPASHDDAAPTATVDSGPIFGAATQLPGASGPVNKFLGIPYAENPERFALSKPPRRWNSPKNATAFGPSCYQLVVETDVGPGKDLLDGLFNQHPPQSEDCLSINAFAPTTPGPVPGRPVIVFIPGGGWQMGNGLLDLSGFAGYEDIVAFAFNYRTNIFGFPNSGELPAQERNLGLHDQRLALEWVQRNARAFGGDPAKVTIWGESAGSLSVDIHMLAYANATKPPFRGAVMSSGESSFGLLGTTTTPNNTKAWDSVAEAAGCRGARKLDCLRGIPAEELVNMMQKAGVTLMPIEDGKAVPAGRAAAWRQGRVAKVPVLAGTIAQEGRALVNHNISRDRFDQAYLPDALFTKDQRGRIYEHYRGLFGLQTDFDVAAAIYTDFVWQCPMHRLTQVSASIRNPTWRYYMNVSLADRLPEEYGYLGKFHGSDVLLLFQSPTYDDSTGAGALLTPVLSTFADYLRGAIGRFARNPSGGPGWPMVGSHFEPFDVVTLGDVGSGHAAGPTPVNQTALDDDCVLFRDALDMYERWMGSG